MTTMLDRACMAVALSPALDRLIQLAKDEDAQSGNQGNATANCVVEMVIAVLEAIRGPSAYVVQAGMNDTGMTYEFNRRAFVAMIGAILDGEE